MFISSCRSNFFTGVRLGSADGEQCRGSSQLRGLGSEALGHRDSAIRRADFRAPSSLGDHSVIYLKHIAHRHSIPTIESGQFDCP
jgi:hypothetical protein